MFINAAGELLSAALVCPEVRYITPEVLISIIRSVELCRDSSDTALQISRDYRMVSSLYLKQIIEIKMFLNKTQKFIFLMHFIDFKDYKVQYKKKLPFLWLHSCSNQTYTHHRNTCHV